MTGSMQIYDPTAPEQGEAKQVRRALDGLRGKVLGFIDNAKPNFNHLVDDVAQVLEDKYGVTRVIKGAKRGAAIPAPGTLVEELAEKCDAVITGSGD